MTNEEMRSLIDNFANSLNAKHGYGYASGYLSSILGSVLMGWYGSNLEEIKAEVSKRIMEMNENNA